MEIGPLDGTSVVQTATNADRSLGKDEFLELLVAQIANQDPLDPLEDKEFIAQLAQFSALEQQLETNQRLSDLQLSQDELNRAQIASWVGRTVDAETNALEIQGGSAPPAVFELQASAAEATIEVVDSAGRVVRTLDRQALPAGIQSVAWDGTDLNGNRLPDGVYTMRVEAFDSNGIAVPAVSRIRGEVTQVNFGQGSVQLMVGKVPIQLGDIISLSQTSNPTPSNP